MKRLSFLMVAMLVSISLILSACGTKEASKDEKSDGGASKETKTLRVVTDAAYAPFESMKGDQIVGFDVDFVNAVAKEAGYKIDLVHVGWDPLFVEIQDKRADLAVSAITIDKARKETYDFSVPYFLSTNKILVPKGSSIKSAADLKGKVIAVQNGTTGQAAAEGILGKNSKDIKKFENNNLAIMELKNKGADAVVADNTVVEEYAKNNPKDKLVVIEDKDSFAQEYYGLMFPKGSELKVKFDEAINKVFDNGTYAKIYQDNFGTEPDIENLKAQQ
ncbi:basic amino acid ABC transporter substrate-binding protein [Cytobacillus sp. Hz8]|uniref:basic amino acid ABC transporter substrate-binding protein n=1 Tax=Cytobacillus sp. Hz8 TaxID=3347168 RepID=UPI0035DB90AA